MNSIAFYPEESAPDSRCWSGVRLDRSGRRLLWAAQRDPVSHGKYQAGVMAGVVVTPDTDRGGVSGKTPCGCQAAIFSFPL